MLLYGKYECFDMQMLYVLCASCGSFQCSILHDLQFANAGRGIQEVNIHIWKRHTPELVSCCCCLP